jgi:cell division protein FtsN
VSSNYRSNAGSKKSIMTPMITGIVIGLLAGVLLALVFAIWLNRNATPFVEKTKSVDLLPTKPARAEPARGEVAQPTPTTTAGVAKENADKPRFDFYQILPGDKAGAKGDGAKGDSTKANKTGKSADDRTTKSAEADANANANAANAGKDAAKQAAKDSYLLQAGAFQSESDAENLKAKIAFAGLEANVRSVNLPDKGTLYRVRLGPYRSLDEVNRIKAALSQNGVAATVVKAE